MVLINDRANDKLNDLTQDNFYIIADFDKTLSTKNSATTLSLFSKSGFYDEKYSQERDENYNYFRPLELNPNITDEEKYLLMKEWQTRSYELMLKYQVRESDIAKILCLDDLIELRDGAIEFISLLNERNVPLIINSAGCGNFIIELLRKYGVYDDNIYVYSNILEFENDVIVDSIKDIIHSMNKFDIKLKSEYLKRISGKRFGIIIGDQLSDLNMLKSLPKEETISFGFLEEKIPKLENLFNENFDVVLKDGESFSEIGKILRLK